MTNIINLLTIAHRMRQTIIDMGYKCGTSAHFGGGLSMVEILTVLYGHVMNYKPHDPRWDGRDRFILSKGHGVLGFYSALYNFQVISQKEIDTFQQNESEFIAHPIMNLDFGIESSNGSLGHGLSFGIGIALAAKLKNKDYKTYVLLGDGECNEGSVWEAAMSGFHYDLDNLTAIVDRNSMQNDGVSDDIMKFNSIESVWRSFGWETLSLDGHNIKELIDAFEAPHNGKPKVIIANTIKGKGIPFMENVASWHHGKLTESTYQEALEHLNSQND